jgi:uncharacterized protein YggU (UPF0235/DUF167 family)
VEALRTRLRLRVVPGARRTGVVGRHGAAWKVRVAAAPERGAANDALVRLLSETLAIAPRGIRLVSGHAARDKIVEVSGISPAEADSRLACAERKDS